MVISENPDHVDEKQHFFQPTKENEQKNSGRKPSNIETCDHKLSDDDDDDDDVDECPLFATGLPSNFSSNPTLAAIASLLEDDEDKVDDRSKCVPERLPNTGGGKATRSTTRSQRNNPYRKPGKQKANNTVKEIELFMKMWKP